MMRSLEPGRFAGLSRTILNIRLPMVFWPVNTRREACWKLAHRKASLRLVLNTSLNERGSIAGLLLAALSMLVAALVFLNRQAVLDHVTVWQYKPSSDIQAFAERAAMNDSGKFYFYAS